MKIPLSFAGRLPVPFRLDLRKDRLKILAILLVLIGVNLLVFIVVNLPRNRELSRLRRDIDVLDRRIGEWEQAVAEQEGLLGRVSDTQNRLSDFYNDRLSIKQAKMTNIMREVRRIAKRFGIDPETINYTDEFIEDQDLVEFGIDVPLVGSYSSLRNFLQQVEISEHFLIIDRISLSGSKEGGTLLSLQIKLLTYFSGLETIPESAQPEDQT
jgi:Tfp pilus assembly protein PilO